jgi:nitroreductase
MSSFRDIIHGRRTIHDYAPEPVPDAVVRLALEAAHAAPCHKLTWPWRFTRVGPTTRETLVALNIRLKGARCALDERQVAKLRAKMMHPGALLVVSQVLAEDPFRRHEDYAATCCAIQNLCLSVTASGFGSKWSTGGVTRHPETYAALGISPEREEIVGFVWIGVPARVPPEPTRPALEDHLRITE